MTRDKTLVVILQVQVTLQEVVIHKDVGTMHVTLKEDVGSQERHSHWYLQFKEEGVVGELVGILTTLS